MNKIPQEPSAPRRLNGWELYERDFNKKTKDAKLAYKHEDGAWAVIRPLDSGFPLLVFAPDGELTEDAIGGLEKLTKFTMRGRRGVEADVDTLTLEGGEEEAYDEYDGMGLES